MSRRSSRKTEQIDLDIEAIETVVTPKKGRKVKIEAVEVTAKSTPSKSTKKVKGEEGEESIKTPDRASANAKSKTSEAKVETKETSKTVKKERKTTIEDIEEEEPAPQVKKGTAKRKAATDVGDVEAANQSKSKKKRKTKEDKEAEAMPVAARTAVGTLKRALYIGAHVSAAGGVQNSIKNALHIGGNAYALFLKSQRKWSSPPMTSEARDQFKEWSTEYKYDPAKHVLPHGSYLVNLAQPDPEKADQAYTCFFDDLQRCEALGIKLYNFHPGSSGKNPRPEAIARIAKQLNKAHKATKTVVTVLENMAGAGNVIGSTWEDLRDIIALIEDKSRVGVCIDTCHTFAAGYDLRTPEAFKKTMDSFEKIVGMSYLKALHLNDSKAPLNSNRDLHANIGTGFLGLRAFHNIVNFSPFQNLPMVLETPIDEQKGADGKPFEDKGVWAKEIKLLEGLVGADTDTEDFKKEESRLQDLGAEQRQKFQGQADKKQQKTLDSIFKKASPKKKIATKKQAESGDDSDDTDGGGCKH